MQRNYNIHSLHGRDPVTVMTSYRDYVVYSHVRPAKENFTMHLPSNALPGYEKQSMTRISGDFDIGRWTDI